MIPALPFWSWWIAAVVLSIAEVLLPGAFFIWLALAAAATGLIVLVTPDGAGEYHLIAFAVLSVLAWVFGRRFVRRHLAATDRPALNRRAEQLIGQRFVLAEAIKGGSGRLQVGDSVWTVSAAEDLAAGTPVIVTGVDGIRLLIEKAA